MGIQSRIQKISNNKDLKIGFAPTTAKIELTGMCTLDCTFCYHKTMKENNIRQKMLDDKAFSMVLRFLKTIPTLKEVGLFYMGESGLHPKLSEYYRALKEEGYFTYLTTNGTTIKNIIPAIPYIDSLKVSWNYIDENDFVSKTRKPKHVYSKIQENIKILSEECKKHNKPLAGSTVLDCDNKETYLANEVVSVFDEHYFIPLQTQGGNFVNGEPGVVGESEKPVSPMPCWSLFKGVYVDCDLNVRLCCYGHKEEHIVGNIGDDIDIEKIMAIQAQQLEKVIPACCRDCLR